MYRYKMVVFEAIVGAWPFGPAREGPGISWDKRKYCDENTRGLEWGENGIGKRYKGIISLMNSPSFVIMVRPAIRLCTWASTGELILTSCASHSISSSTSLANGYWLWIFIQRLWIGGNDRRDGASCLYEKDCAKWDAICSAGYQYTSF